MQVGDLHVVVGADTRPLEQGEKRVNKSIDNIDGRLTSMSKSVSSGLTRQMTIAAAVIAGAAIAIHGVVKRIEEVSDAAVQAGISLEKMSALTFSSSFEGVKNFDKALLTLYKNMAISDPMSEQRLTFDQLGISVRNADGSIRAVDMVLGDLANKFQKYKDGPEKTAIAMRLMGESAAGMVPFLNRGAGGISTLQREAEKMGGVLDSQTGVVVKAINEDFSRMGGAVTAVSNQFMRAFGPAIQSITRWISDLTTSIAINLREMGFMDKIARGLRIGFEVLAYSIKEIARNIGLVGQLLTKAVTLRFSEMAEVIEQHSKQAEVNFKYHWDNIASHQQFILDRNWNAITEYAAKAPAPIVKSAAEIEKALQQIKQTNQYNLADLIGSSTTEAAMKLLFLEEMVKKGQTTWREYLEAVKTVNAEIYANMKQDFLDVPTVPLEEKMAALKRAVDEGTISWREYRTAMEGVSEQGKNAMNDLASTTSQALTTIFKENKTAAIASAIINTYQGITKAIANYPPPMSYAMAGLQAAMGFAQVQQIKNTSKSSSGGGSSAPSSAGASTAAASGGGGSGGGQQTLYVQGISKSERFDRETVRHLAQSLIDHQRDGGRVILAP